MNRFIINNQLVIPEEEIDNIYVWTRVSNTQEVLLSSKAYFKLLEHSFNEDAKRVISTLRLKKPSISLDMYKFCDFITFTANKDKIFKGHRMCFAYMTNLKMLNSLICYIAHIMNVYLPEDESLSSLILNKVNNPEIVTSLMNKEFLILRAQSILPEHKYRSAILDSMLSSRSQQNRFTLIHLLNKAILIGKDLILEDYAKDKSLVDLSPLSKPFEERRHATYQALLKIWYELQKSISQFVYSETTPSNVIRERRK